jgi:hypothetical protein
MVEGGGEHERYTRSVFYLACIAKHITHNKLNSIISELQFSVNTVVVLTNADAFVVTPYLSELLEATALLNASNNQLTSDIYATNASYLCKCKNRARYTPLLVR